MKKIQEILDKIDLKKPIKERFETGFKDLDNILDFDINSGKVITLASRPAMGKSSLALNIAKFFSRSSHKSSLIFSCEMDSKELMLNMISSESKVDLRKIKRGKCSTEELSLLNKARESLSDIPIWTNENFPEFTEEIIQIVKEISKESEIGLIVIDYLQLLKTQNRTLRFENEVSNMMKDLKKLAADFEMTVLLLSQLNRGVDARDNKRPLLSDLRESAAIEDASDVVCFLYRDGYYYLDLENSNFTELIVAKNRGGKLGTVNLIWKPEIRIFSIS